jgi:hypothetical protein
LTVYNTYSKKKKSDEEMESLNSVLLLEADLPMHNYLLKVSSEVFVPETTILQWVEASKDVYLTADSSAQCYMMKDELLRSFVDKYLNECAPVQTAVGACLRTYHQDSQMVIQIS